MKFLSTTALAKSRDISTSQMFEELMENGWMYKKNDTWTLTSKGQLVGGKVEYNPKFGEYIVWPENLDLEQAPDFKSMLSSTNIGEHFDLSARKVNLFLSELGWIEKDPVGGWKPTKQGVKNGAHALEARNGAPYVMWSEAILENKHLLKSFANHQELDPEEVEGPVDDIRLKQRAEIRTQDGHYVRSRAEKMIDDFLYVNGIPHAYERKLPVDELLISDFYIPSGKVYIEYWGLESNVQYRNRKEEKKRIYTKYEYNLVEISESDINNLEETLQNKLRRFGISTD